MHDEIFRGTNFQIVQKKITMDSYVQSEVIKKCGKMLIDNWVKNV